MLPSVVRSCTRINFHLQNIEIYGVLLGFSETTAYGQDFRSVCVVYRKLITKQWPTVQHTTSSYIMKDIIGRDSIIDFITIYHKFTEIII